VKDAYVRVLVAVVGAVVAVLALVASWYFYNRRKSNRVLDDDDDDEDNNAGATMSEVLVIESQQFHIDAAPAAATRVAKRITVEPSFVSSIDEGGRGAKAEEGRDAERASIAGGSHSNAAFR
jgi:hypothetical protein